MHLYASSLVRLFPRAEFSESTQERKRVLFVLFAIQVDASLSAVSQRRDAQLCLNDHFGGKRDESAGHVTWARMNHLFVVKENTVYLTHV